MQSKSYGAARVRSASFNEEANTVEIVWSTGADVVRDDYDGPFIERLLMGADNVRLERLNSGAPLLDTHDSTGLSSVIGSVVSGSARIEDGKGLATVKLSSAAGDVDAVSKIREGVVKNISVGYVIHSSTRVAGERGEPDVIEITDWEPIEVSAVPIPADPGAVIRSAGRDRPRSRQTPAQRAAAYATSLLTGHRSVAEARGAKEARAALGTIGRLQQVPKVGKIDKRDLAAGAHEARKLLRK